MFWLTLLPICGGIGASLALQGSILGAVVFIVLFNVVHLGLRFGLAHYAYRMGVAAIPLIKAKQKSRTRGVDRWDDGHWRAGGNLCPPQHHAGNHRG
jgi:mannose/fructose/N-acetylgalactosamine-specific phosphotransferase system component IID